MWIQEFNLTFCYIPYSALPCPLHRDWCTLLTFLKGKTNYTQLFIHAFVTFQLFAIMQNWKNKMSVVFWGHVPLCLPQDMFMELKRLLFCVTFKVDHWESVYLLLSVFAMKEFAVSKDFPGNSCIVSKLSNTTSVINSCGNFSHMIFCMFFFSRIPKTSKVHSFMVSFWIFAHYIYCFKWLLFNFHF